MAKLVGNRYAKALYNLGIEDNKIEKFYEDIKLVSNLIKENDDMLKIINHPNISNDEKLNIFKTSFRENVSEEIYGFLQLIFAKNRDTYLLDIFQSFIELVENYLGITNAEIISAYTLSEDQVNQIKTKLINKINKKVNINCIVDENILGGLIIKVDGLIFDSSVYTKIQSIKKELYS